MARSDAARLAQLQEIYDRLPVVHCKGLCANECTSISMSDVEHRRMKRAGYTIPKVTPENLGTPCPALTKDNRCGAYEARPFICRAYGAVEGSAIACKHGCEIEGEPISNLESLELLNETYAIGGGRLRKSAQEAREILRIAGVDPDARQTLDMVMTAGGRLQVVRTMLNRTVFNPLSPGGRQ